jgi:peptide/nickel transport system substrate-binding protein
LLAASIPTPAHSDANLPPARIRFTCLIPENFALWERIGLLVQRDLAEVGVDMKLEALPPMQFNERIASGDFDAVLLEMIVGNTASRPFTFWHSRSRQNVWGYRSADVDSALDALRQAASDDSYKAAYKQFQTQSLTDAPAIFIALGETTRAVSKRFEVVAPPGSDIVRTIADWRLAAREPRGAN